MGCGFGKDIISDIDQITISYQPKMWQVVDQYYLDHVKVDEDLGQMYHGTVIPQVTEILKYISSADSRFSGRLLFDSDMHRGLKANGVNEGRNWCYVLMDGEINNEDVLENDEDRYYGFTRLEDGLTDPIHQHLDVAYIRDLSLPPPRDGKTFVTDQAFQHWENKTDYVRGGDVVPFLVRRRLRNLIQRAFHNLDIEGEVIEPTEPRDGPCLSINFTTDDYLDDSSFRVDFAPAIRCPTMTFLSDDWADGRPYDWPDDDKIEDIQGAGGCLLGLGTFYWTESTVCQENELFKGLDKSGTRRQRVYRILSRINHDFWCKEDGNCLVTSDMLKSVWSEEMAEYQDNDEWDDYSLWHRIKNISRRLLGHLQKENPVLEHFLTEENVMIYVNDDRDMLNNTIERIQEFVDDARSKFNTL